MSLNRKPAATQINMKKNFLSQNFSYLSLLKPAINLYFRISPRIFLKFVKAQIVYTGAKRKLIHEKKPGVEKLLSGSL